MNPVPAGYTTTTDTLRNCNKCTKCIAMNGVLYCNRANNKPSGGMYLSTWCRNNQTGFDKVCNEIVLFTDVTRMVITRGSGGLG